MPNDLLSGKPAEIVEKSLFLRSRGYSDDEILALAFSEARKIYSEICEQRGVEEYAMPFLLRDLAAGIRYMETGEYSDDGELAEHGRRIESLERYLCFIMKPSERRRPSNPQAWDLFSEG